MRGPVGRHRSIWDGLMERLVPEDHLLVRIDREVDFSFVGEVTRDLYSPGMGRPAIAPELLFRSLVIAFLYHLSDVEVCHQLRYNVLYRWFVGLGLEDDPPDDTTLVVFRRRLGTERVQQCFDRVLDQAKAKGLLSGRFLVVDATRVRADAALVNHAELLRQARRRIWERVAREPERQARWRARVGEGPDRDAMARMSPTERAAFEEERSRALLAVAREEEEQFDPEVEAALGALEQILDGDPDAVQNFVDPDARWGFSTTSEAHFGYKVHAAADENGIVTAVRVAPANEHEAGQLPALLAETVHKGVELQAVTADKGYDSAANRKAIRRHGLKAHIPMRYPHKTVAPFTWEPTRRRLRCPAGRLSIGKYRHHKRNGDVYYFSLRDCGRCPLADGCLTPGERRKTVYLSDRYRAAVEEKARLRESRSVRAGIERLFAEAKRWHGLGRARWRGQRKLWMQALWTFMVMNLKKMARRVPCLAA